MPASAVTAASVVPGPAAGAADGVADGSETGPALGPASERSAACQDSCGWYPAGFQAKSPAVASAIRDATGCRIPPVSSAAERDATSGSRPVYAPR